MDKYDILAQLMADESIAKEVLTIEDPKDVQRYLADRGVKLSIEEILEWAKEITLAVSNEELNADTLDSVAGGIRFTPTPLPIPKMPFPRIPWPKIW